MIRATFHQIPLPARRSHFFPKFSPAASVKIPPLVQQRTAKRSNRGGQDMGPPRSVQTGCYGIRITFARHPSPLDCELIFRHFVQRKHPHECLRPSNKRGSKYSTASDPISPLLPVTSILFTFTSPSSDAAPASDAHILELDFPASLH